MEITPRSPDQMWILFRPSQVSSSEVLEAEAVSGLHIEAEFLTSIPKKTFSPAFFPSSRARR